jgi:hypothetical protein
MGLFFIFVAIVGSAWLAVAVGALLENILGKKGR